MPMDTSRMKPASCCFCGNCHVGWSVLMTPWSLNSSFYLIQEASCPFPILEPSSVFCSRCCKPSRPMVAEAAGTCFCCLTVKTQTVSAWLACRQQQEGQAPTEHRGDNVFQRPRSCCGCCRCRFVWQPRGLRPPGHPSEAGVAQATIACRPFWRDTCTISTRSG